MSLKSILFSFGIAMVSALPASAQDTDALERDLDQAIKSACHGFMVDALPDALARLRTEIYENSPFCTRIQNAGDLEAFGEAIQDTLTRLSKDDVRLDLSQKQDRDLNVTIECDSEYMCMEVRLAFQETDTPVAQSDYNAVQAYCDGRYGCIQAYFADWPAPLPVPTPITEAEMIRFDEIVTAPVPKASAPRSGATDRTMAAQDAAAGQPVADTADAQTMASDSQADAPPPPQQAAQTQLEQTQLEQTQPIQAQPPTDTSTDTPTDTGQAETAQTATADPPAADDPFIMGPRQMWEDATAYCERLGRRLPTVAEGRPLHEDIPNEDWWFGMWTSEVSYRDAYVWRIRTVRPGGSPSTENGFVWEALTVCVE